ncbi:hypothetical protein F7Q91_03105 [Vibrio chagasii]|uniref:Conjugal transfer protein TrbC n=1 Tax=Vibrio chagasii TaxID=170679 RepID=A0A7V7NX11_9VIBR|nr:hypothetical protein [Vibrio chagasii]KAB0482410.1 hypothetical protein F7Q91_03105 [Vibrio chagasii]
MKNIVKKVVLGMSTLPFSVLAAGETKMEKGMKNVDAIFGAGGSAMYTAAMFFGIGLIVFSLCTWAWNSRDSQTPTKGQTQMVLICAIAGCALTFPSAWINYFGEAAAVVETTTSGVNYRDLKGQQ